MSTTPEYDQDGRSVTPGDDDRPSRAAEATWTGAQQPTAQQPTAQQPTVESSTVPQEQHHPMAQQPTSEAPTVPQEAFLQHASPAAGTQQSAAAPTQHVSTPQAHAPYGAYAESQHAYAPAGGDAQAHAATHSQPPYAYGAPAVTPDSAGHGGGALPPVSEPRAASAQGKNRSGALLAGLAIGALLGGVAGGGVAAVVSANADPSGTASSTGNGAITLNNAENATAISGVAAVATPSVVTLEVAGASASGSGSGVIYREDGYIITNAHVVTLDGAALSDATIRVKLSDGRIFAGELVNVDPYSDLAVVKIDATDLPAVEVADSDKIDVGDLTVAIGAPLNLANTVTSGVVSALNRGISVGSPLIEDDRGQEDDGDSGGGFPWDFRFGLPDEEGQQGPQQPSSSGTVTLPVIQTDASINPGNSGGALLNGNGELIGINVAIASTSTTGETAGSVGLGFAIPANLVTRVADAIIDGEQPSHGLLGASVADSSQDTDADANHAGGLLVDVSSGGAAEEAGLRAGDVITAIDGIAAVDGTSVSALIRGNAGGSTVTISYTRDGQAAETEATLGTLEW